MILLFFILFSFFPSSSMANSSPENWRLTLYPKGNTSLPIEIHEVQDYQVPRIFQGYLVYSASFDAAVYQTSDSDEPLGIYLGNIGDVDEVYINKHLVGKTGQFPPHYKNFMDAVRLYPIQRSILNSDRNTVTVRAYVEYLTQKGLDINKVKIDSYHSLSQRKFLEILRRSPNFGTDDTLDKTGQIYLIILVKFSDSFSAFSCVIFSNIF